LEAIVSARTPNKPKEQRRRHFVSFDYVVAPSLILLIAVLVSWICLRRIFVSTKSYRKWRQISERVVLLIVLLVVVFLGGSTAFNALAMHHYWKMNPPPGKLYDVRGSRMYLYCTGDGSPALILDAGLGNDSLIWSKVQPELSKTTRVCSYDRAGYGRSDPRPAPRDANRIADELNTLLTQAGVTGPIVLMGHSIAGIYIRAYATRFPEGLAGLVFVDGSTPLQDERPEFKAVESKGPSPALALLAMKPLFILGIPRTLGTCSHPSPGFEARFRKMLAEDQCRPPLTAMGLEFESRALSGNETIRSGPFGDLPVLIFSHDPNTSLPIHVPPQLEHEFAMTWNQMQEDLKNLSTRSRRIIAKGSGHYIQLDREDLLNREVPIFIQQIRGSAAHPTNYRSTSME
jgi:pimeloyl-ACP methyl ester carboxylesterase